MKIKTKIPYLFYITISALVACSTSSKVTPVKPPEVMYTSDGTVSWVPPGTWKLSEYNAITKGLWRGDSAPQGWISIQERDLAAFVDPSTGRPIQQPTALEISNWEQQSERATLERAVNRSQYQDLGMYRKRLGQIDGACSEYRILEISGNVFRRITCGFIQGPLYHRFSFSGDEKQNYLQGLNDFQAMLGSLKRNG